MTAKPTTTTPAVAAEPVETEAKPLSRTELLAVLHEKEYTGPTSFTASTLRDVLAWVEAGSSADAEGGPSGVMFAVHPDLRPARATRPVRMSKYQQGYKRALAEVAAFGRDLKQIESWVADNRVPVDA